MPGVLQGMTNLTLAQEVAIGRKGAADELRSGSLRGERSDPPTRSLARVIVASPSLANVNIMTIGFADSIVHPPYSLAHDRSRGIGLYMIAPIVWR
jgi:hypothetical protein